jgi:hypothetical protein
MGDSRLHSMTVSANNDQVSDDITVPECLR